jgi:hypothetical protein
VLVLGDGADADGSNPCVQVIHSELDYRLTISEGVAAFNVLQTRGVPSKFLVFTDENHVSCRVVLSLSAAYAVVTTD